MPSFTLSLLLLTAPVVAAPAPLPQQDRRSDRDRVQGEWEVSYEAVGVAVNAGESRDVVLLPASREGHTATFTGGRLLWRFGGEMHSEDVARLDRGRIDLTDVRSGRTWRGAYGLEGDKLTICLSPEGEAARPASLRLSREGQRVYVLRRR